jgi:hypothetical protein
MFGYLSAFGVKRTCATVRLRPPQAVEPKADIGPSSQAHLR